MAALKKICARMPAPRATSIHQIHDINLVNLLNYLMAASEKICARTPAPRATSIHQIHAAGGLGGSTTVVMVFVRWFVLFVWFLTRDSSVGYVLPTFKRCYSVSHPGLHHNPIIRGRTLRPTLVEARCTRQSPLTMTRDSYLRPIVVEVHCTRQSPLTTGRSLRPFVVKVTCTRKSPPTRGSNLRPPRWTGCTRARTQWRRLTGSRVISWNRMPRRGRGRSPLYETKSERGGRDGV